MKLKISRLGFRHRGIADGGELGVKCPLDNEFHTLVYCADCSLYEKVDFDYLYCDGGVEEDSTAS